MKTLFYNGNIYIGNKDFAYGFIVKDNVITKIIKNENEVIESCDYHFDLQKKTVIHSLIDGHNHFLMASSNMNNLDISKIKSEEELIKTIKQHYLLNNDLNFLYFEGLTINNFSSPINKHVLDKISCKIPIMIHSSDRHTAFLNTASLNLFNLNTKNPKSLYGGIIDLDNDLFPNGIIRENACNYVNTYIKENENQNKKLKQMEKLESILIKQGIGVIGTCDISDYNFDKTITLYKEFNKNKYINIVHQCPLFNLDNLESFINKLNKEKLFTNKFQIKLFIDGSLSSNTAALSDKYLNSNSNGILIYNSNLLTSTINKINNKNISVVTHCIGDLAIKQIIDIYKENNGEINNGIIHYQINNKNLDDQVLQKNINVCVQPCFIEDDLNIIDKYLNKKIKQEAYQYKELYLKNNNLVSFGTDAPICEYDPWKNIYYAISNKQINSNKKWNQQANFDLYQAIECYTKNTARFLNLKNIGLIKEGYLANFIVLNQNIFELKNKESILKTKVISHYLNGKKVF